MKYYFFLFLFLSGISSWVYAQRKPSRPRTINLEKNTAAKKTSEPSSNKRDYTLYKSFKQKGDTVLIDTTLTIQKVYQTNYLKKDLFGKNPFHNQGQVLNNLVYDSSSSDWTPHMGMLAKHVNYLNAKDINYFEVPTPTTTLYYYSGMTQGQVLDSWFTANLNKKTNFAIAYKGLRSLGKYRNTLSSHGNFRLSLHHSSANDKYHIKAHYAQQDLMNQENGGLNEQALNAFINNDADFTDRGKIDVQLNDAESELEGKRFFVTQHYVFGKKKEVLRHPHFKIAHELIHEKKSFRFSSSDTDLFGARFVNIYNDNSNFQSLSNKLTGHFDVPKYKGTLSAYLKHQQFQNQFDNIVITNNEVIPQSMFRDYVAIGGVYKQKIKKFQTKLEVNQILSGNIEGYLYRAEAQLKNKTWHTRFSASLKSSQADFQKQLFQSNAIGFNWKNNLKNIQNRHLNALFSYKKLLRFDIAYHSIDNQAYFYGENIGSAEVIQTDKTINILKLKANQHITFGKFGFENTIAFQEVDASEQIINLPQWVSRSTLYFTDILFKQRSLELFTGFTLNYFSAYHADLYQPILGSFVTQNNTLIGNQPTVDFFANGKVRRTRIYFKIDNVLANWTDKKYFSDPINPSRDLVIRFGIVWNFFN